MEIYFLNFFQLLGEQNRPSTTARLSGINSLTTCFVLSFAGHLWGCQTGCM